jgi:hypothetical protein
MPCGRSASGLGTGRGAPALAPTQERASQKHRPPAGAAGRNCRGQAGDRARGMKLDRINRIGTRNPPRHHPLADPGPVPIALPYHDHRSPARDQPGQGPPEQPPGHAEEGTTAVLSQQLQPQQPGDGYITPVVELIDGGHGSLRGRVTAEAAPTASLRDLKRKISASMGDRAPTGGQGFSRTGGRRRAVDSCTSAPRGDASNPAARTNLAPTGLIRSPLVNSAPAALSWHGAADADTHRCLAIRSGRPQLELKPLGHPLGAAHAGLGVVDPGLVDSLLQGSRWPSADPTPGREGDMLSGRAAGCRPH